MVPANTLARIMAMEWLSDSVCLCKLQYRAHMCPSYISLWFACLLSLNSLLCLLQERHWTKGRRLGDTLQYIQFLNNAEQSKLDGTNTKMRPNICYFLCRLLVVYMTLGTHLCFVNCDNGVNLHYTTDLTYIYSVFKTELKFFFIPFQMLIYLGWHILLVLFHRTFLSTYRFLLPMVLG